MKSVLISIRPKWCELIANGKKTIEVRKRKPKLKTPFKCYIYETKSKTEIPTFIDEEGHAIYKGRGQVIGDFVCDTIYHFVQAGAGIMFADENFNLLTPQQARKTTCLNDIDIDDYLDNKDGYGWHISDLKIYNKPKELLEFIKPCENDLYCEECAMFRNFEDKCGNSALQIKRPPQSWCYVEV